MLDGKLRIAPTCYHVLHQVPVMTAHELNFLYDEGLKTAHLAWKNWAFRRR
jgi:hypothetical protein